MSDENDKLKDQFYEKVPSLFTEQINFILHQASLHIDELKNLQTLIDSVTRCMPEVYRSKYGRIVDNRGELFIYCKIPYLDGIIENCAYYLESEFGEVIYSILGGAYRSSLINLRHMLQLSCWLLQAVADKSGLTDEPLDSGKSMDIEEFERFLEENMGNVSKKKSTNLDKTVKSKIRVIEGIGLNNKASEIITIITYKGKVGRKGIKQLYGDLSGFAHANIFQRVNLLEETERFFPAHNKSEFEGKGHHGRFHRTLYYISNTIEIILCLLLLSAFEELYSHSPYRTNNFLLNFAEIFKSIKHPKLKRVNLTLEILQNKLDPELIKRDEHRISKYDLEEIVCPECELRLFDDERCPFCDE